MKMDGERTYTVSEMRELADALELEKRIRKLENQLHGVEVRRLSDSITRWRDSVKHQNREIDQLRERLNRVEDVAYPIQVRSCHRCGLSGKSQRSAPGLCVACNEWLERECDGQT